MRRAHDAEQAPRHSVLLGRANLAVTRLRRGDETAAMHPLLMRIAICFASPVLALLPVAVAQPTAESSATATPAARAQDREALF